MTDATPLMPAGPTPVPTPLASDTSRTGPGMDIPTIISTLLGVVCAGYIAYLGYVMIRK
jgi:hypothetical protein